MSRTRVIYTGIVVTLTGCYGPFNVYEKYISPLVTPPAPSAKVRAIISNDSTMDATNHKLACIIIAAAATTANATTAASSTTTYDATSICCSINTGFDT